MFFIIPVIFFTFLTGFILWKINSFSVNCPNCGNLMSFIRIPTSIQQALWGGWTCPQCGCEMDKWGIEISAVNEKNLSLQQLEESKVESIKSFDSKGNSPIERIFEENN